MFSKCSYKGGELRGDWGLGRCGATFHKIGFMKCANVGAKVRKEKNIRMKEKTVRSVFQTLK